MRNFVDFSMNDAVTHNKPPTAPVMLPKQTQKMEQSHPKKPRGQPIPTKPILESEPPPFILPLYPSSKWGIANPQLHAKWEREKAELQEANLLKMASPKCLAGTKGGKKKEGNAKGVEMGKPKKPLKVIKVIKRIQKEDEETDGTSGYAPWVKGSVQKKEIKNEGKGKMNQAILDKLIKEDIANRCHENEKEELPIPTATQLGATSSAAWEMGLTFDEESPQEWGQTWGDHIEQYEDEEQWETMMDDENAEMEWEDAQEFWIILIFLCLKSI